MKPFITVFTTSNLGEAEIIKGMLINHNIEAIVVNELSTQMLPVTNGIEVKVRELDAEEALRILRLRD